ncbi:MAG: 50S ribosomal protein L24 [Candidatus Curtissbacteria bacterium GW2011_GWA1_40_9]|uniref:Large ribosomal subunit protein uL24 n=1 Tax=Candidatus Curtissbacteria bacterium GW2011_GWA1_40_9 TaxID=1618408 RepID=A0A0G0TLZ9_9BACT|nr:MAG: 50S ribosomal protein L24 [Candidatus Curtissbacteria bacterium GW2011_GWA1_40_9]
MFKFKTGDEVIVTAGRDKGKKGKVQKVWGKEYKLTVSGVNIYKRHKKATRSQKSGIFEVNRPITVANVQIICPKCGKQTKISFQTIGKFKERVCKKCKGIVTVERSKK